MKNEEYNLFTTLRSKVGEETANVIAEYIRDEVSTQVKAKEERLATKDDIKDTKDDIKELDRKLDALFTKLDAKLDAQYLKLDSRFDVGLAKQETGLAWRIYATGFVQFMAMIVSLIALLKFFDLK